MLIYTSLNWSISIKESIWSSTKNIFRSDCTCPVSSLLKILSLERIGGTSPLTNYSVRRTRGYRGFTVDTRYGLLRDMCENSRELWPLNLLEARLYRIPVADKMVRLCKNENVLSKVEAFSPSAVRKSSTTFWRQSVPVAHRSTIERPRTLKRCAGRLLRSKRLLRRETPGSKAVGELYFRGFSMSHEETNEIDISVQPIVYNIA